MPSIDKEYACPYYDNELIIQIENSWDNNEKYYKEVFLEDALDDIKESAYEDEEVDIYLEDYPTKTIHDFVEHILYCAKKDLENGYVFEYGGYTYMPIKKKKDIEVFKMNKELKKEYYILPVDNYGQPNGYVEVTMLTEKEYKELKKSYVYIYDNIEQAYRRALD